MQPLDPLTIPLNGQFLIEASAGTGKTYTLVLLFLRLLLERQLKVDQILVVTFTRAATRELRDRIRKRLHEALLFFEERGPLADKTLATFLNQIPSARGQQLLKDALIRMDEAAIYTIHGFCQRILQDQAFETRSPFSFDLLEDEEPLRRQIIADYWRNRFYSAPPEEAAWAAVTWKHPDHLLARLGSAATAYDLQLIPHPPDTTLSQDLITLSEALFQEIRQLWPGVRDEVRMLLEDDPCLQRNEKAYRLSDRVPEILAAMDTLARLDHMPFLLPQRIDLLAHSRMAGLLLKRCDQPPRHFFFDRFDAFLATHRQRIRQCSLQVEHGAHRYLVTELDRRKRQQEILSYDDLLLRLDDALTHPVNGSRLARGIASRFPAALVDEFQDTDQLQYSLIQAIYRGQQTALFLIGDPKQAIYSFRGADIFTYIRARRDTLPASRFTMDTNYRSTPAMVNAVNTLFGRENPFLFANDIPFYPVNADPQSSDHEQQPALAPCTALILAGDGSTAGSSRTINKAAAAEAAAAACAAEIHRLLSGSADTLITGEEPLPVPEDIAVLVRTHQEGECMRQALRQRGLNSVSSSQTSVFATEEARKILLLLKTLADLTDTARLASCLVTDLFGLNANELAATKEKVAAWEGQVHFLLRLQQLWHDHGFGPMFHALLAARTVTRRLTAQEGGERKLTNYLHLAELLQESDAAQHGMDTLVRWLEQQTTALDRQAGDQLLRLESDERLIRIVTIHSAKGLEFPIVFLPFPWASRTPPANSPLLFHDRTTLRLKLDLGSGEPEYQFWADEERRSEEIRLLYVALTRAKKRCYFCWGRITGAEDSALAYLLSSPGQGWPQSDEDLIAGLQRCNQNSKVMDITFVGECAAPPLQQPAPPAPLVLQAKIFQGVVNSGWSLYSYSRLAAGEMDSQTDHDRDEPAQIAPAEDFINIFTFPRGQVAGSCLHAILETLDFHRPTAEQQPLIDAQLARAGIDMRWQPAVFRWLEAVLKVDLPGACPLGSLSQADMISEFGFHFSLEQVSLRRLKAVFAAGGYTLPFEIGTVLTGLMKGFIDLVFRHQGRYFLIDYKSNHLGMGIGHYREEALRAVMDRQHYHLQYLVYTLALHRYLATRMNGYDYNTHFGGVFYLFLRAMHPDHPEGTGIFRVRPEARLIQELDRCCNGEDC